MNLTEHFTEEELISSQKAEFLRIDNTPPIEIRMKLRFTADGLERIRALLGFPMKILSGYRCSALNSAVGGSVNSQHMRGEAADFICHEFGTPFEICTFLKSWMNVAGIDQMIMEGTWVHVSFSQTPRKQILTFNSGKYFNGLIKT